MSIPLEDDIKSTVSLGESNGFLTPKGYPAHDILWPPRNYAFWARLIRSLEPEYIGADTQIKCNKKTWKKQSGF
ncbi:MAG: hypothetical protein CM1200mP22_07080 [Dehalococcoidia bacterium]|nr:MAG: hypothetical protein CM1200mP22_07080 [Dehalococcoidia bacterium]